MKGRLHGDFPDESLDKFKDTIRAQTRRHNGQSLQAVVTDLKKLYINTKDTSEISKWLTGTTPLLWEASGEKRSANGLDLQLKTNRRSLLVLNEYFRNDWQATLNGNRVKTFKVNLNQIGVMLPEGLNHVHFEYRPWLFIWLSYVQRAAFVVMVAGILAIRYRRSSPRIPLPSLQHSD